MLYVELGEVTSYIICFQSNAKERCFREQDHLDWYFYWTVNDIVNANAGRTLMQISTSSMSAIMKLTKHGAISTHTPNLVIANMSDMEEVRICISALGKYVVHTEDLPRASELPFAQRPTKRTKFRKDAGKIYNYICGGVARVVVPSVRIWREKISSAYRKQTFQSGVYGS